MLTGIALSHFAWEVSGLTSAVTKVWGRIKNQSYSCWTVTRIVSLDFSVLELSHQKYCEIYICKKYCPSGFFQLGGILHNVVIFMTKCPQLTAVPSLSFKLRTFCFKQYPETKNAWEIIQKPVSLLGTHCNVWLLFAWLGVNAWRDSNCICSQAEGKVLNCSIPKPSSATLAWSGDLHKSSIWAVSNSGHFSTQFHLFHNSP